MDNEPSSFIPHPSSLIPSARSLIPSIRLQILVPDAVVLNTRVTGIQAADATGRFGLRPGHERFVTVLTPSLLIYTDEEGRERYAAVDGGILLLEGDQVSVVTRDAVLADRLEDVAERAAAILDARQQQEHRAQVEFDELRITLVKQLARVRKPS